MRRIGLFFGSFNPVHVGHLIIAEHVVSTTDLDQLWMVVSPHNPFKKKSSLAGDYDRLHMLRLAIDDNPRIRASDVEFSLPKPSYTIDTLSYLQERYPDDAFTLIMGGDNLASLHRWKNYDAILEHYHIIVYSRPGYALGELQEHPSVRICEAPMLDISASHIRARIRAGLSIRYLVPEALYQYIDGSSMYREERKI